MCLTKSVIVPETKKKTFADEFNIAKEKVICSRVALATKNAILQKFPKTKDLLDTDFGAAMVSTGIGFAFSYLPKFKSQPYANVLSSELRNGTVQMIAIIKRKIVRSI